MSSIPLPARELTVHESASNSFTFVMLLALSMPTTTDGSRGWEAKLPQLTPRLPPAAQEADKITAQAAHSNAGDRNMVRAPSRRRASEGIGMEMDGEVLEVGGMVEGEELKKREMEGAGLSQWIQI